MKPFLTKMAAAEGAPVARVSLEGAAKWYVLQHLPVVMKVRIPLAGVVLRGLTQLKAGMVFSTEWPASEEVPLYAQDVAMGWCEFEVVEGKIAVRLTRLA